MKGLCQQRIFKLPQFRRKAASAQKDRRQIGSQLAQSRNNVGAAHIRQVNINDHKRNRSVILLKNGNRFAAALGSSTLVARAAQSKSDQIANRHFVDDQDFRSHAVGDGIMANRRSGHGNRGMCEHS